MRLTNAKYNLQIEMQENRIDVLIIENPMVMAEMVGGLQEQCNGMEGDFVLSENNEIIRLDKNFAMVVNPFSLEFNDRKILNKLYSELSVSGNEYFLEKEKINTEIIKLLEKVISNQQYDSINFKLEMDWNELFKMYSVKLEENSDSLLEKIIEYIKILSGLCSIRVLCLVNIKNYLDETEINQLYEMAFYNKIQLLLIEANEKKNCDNENSYIIDNDRCLIIK